MASYDLPTGDISQWRSIFTLVVFLVINTTVAMFPFHIPLYVPRKVSSAILDSLTTLRITQPLSKAARAKKLENRWVRFNIPVGMSTAPLAGVLLLLATTAIGRKEVKQGTIGANNIVPLDIVAFALTMGYTVASIDATGLIRYLSFKTLRHFKVGHRVFFSLYFLFFGVGFVFGNDPVVQMGAMFLSYMTRVVANIVHPRAWIHTHFAIANVASTIFVSSSTTNVVIAQTFKVGFAEYTANVIVPVILAVILLCPFLLYVVFADEALVPLAIKMREIPEEQKQKKPTNPHIPMFHSDGESDGEKEENKTALTLEEIMNPYLDKASAVVGVVIMLASLVVLLALAAAGLNNVPVFWVTLPAAFLKLCWDLAIGWAHRRETRVIARQGRMNVEVLRRERESQRKLSRGEKASSTPAGTDGTPQQPETLVARASPEQQRATPMENHEGVEWHTQIASTDKPKREEETTADCRTATVDASLSQPSITATQKDNTKIHTDDGDTTAPGKTFPGGKVVPETPNDQEPKEKAAVSPPVENKPTLVSLMADLRVWARETFPSATILVERLPFSIIPFAIPTFILVQALVSTGWVAVFARGWNHWAQKTGTVGAIGGMGFLSVVLSNFAGTNIGATVLLSRILQDWAELHAAEGERPLSQRTFWGVVYALAIGTNYGAFSITFGASLAGIGWRRDLKEKRIQVPSLEFARVNLPLIVFTMVVSCSVLVGQVYIVRDDTPYAAR
ncbi:hypothetical protein GGR56DRAFT_552620 [Xylariaceae sp. FL0804]|nr:hypothetical protein GGR56DRAFT_552620 [Xylariaceae sp. FL0804]